MSQARIDQLATQLQAAADAYYGPSGPVMSDASYDKLYDELVVLDPTHAFLTKVGASVADSGWKKAKHGRPMASLNKAQSEAEFRAWAAACGFQDGSDLIEMDKLDGASISLRWENGRFVQGITRGDGETGEDITVNAQQMQFPKVIPGGLSGYVRGEVIVKQSVFKAEFPGQSNPRNTANGTMKRQSDADGCKHLTVIAFDWLPDTGALPSKSDEFKLLETWGFETPRWAVVASLTEAEKVYADYVATIRDSLDYDIDGLVIQFDDQDTMESLGDQGRGPKGAVAYKFCHEEKETILRDIQWQVGKSGRITPVAIFDEVDCGGARLKRASLAGVRQVEHLKLYTGCRILVARRNDVIPRVEANLDLGIENDV